MCLWFSGLIVFLLVFQFENSDPFEHYAAFYLVPFKDTMIMNNQANINTQ